MSMKCFVISPIGDERSETREHADEVFSHIIEPALAHFHIEAIRSDRMKEPGSISDQMFRAIFEYDLCIAVLTYPNPNVYYELAVAQSACRPVVVMTEKGATLPFDVKDFRSLTYDLRITAYKEETHINRLIGMLGELEKSGWRGDDVSALIGVSTPRSCRQIYTASASLRPRAPTPLTWWMSKAFSSLSRQDTSFVLSDTTHSRMASFRTEPLRSTDPRRLGVSVGLTLVGNQAKNEALRSL
jgi:hypothetical protein